MPLSYHPGHTRNLFLDVKSSICQIQGFYWIGNNNNYSLESTYFVPGTVLNGLCNYLTEHSATQ